MDTFTYDIHELMLKMHMTSIVYKIKFKFLQDQSKNDEKQEKQELERRSTLENRNWSDRSSRSTTTTPLAGFNLQRFPKKVAKTFLLFCFK